MHQRFLLSFVALAFIFSSLSAEAGKVYKVKGKKVYIKLSKKEVRKYVAGDVLYILNKKKKKIATVIIKKIKKKKRKAITRVKKKKRKIKKGYRTKLKKPKMKRLDDYEDNGSSGYQDESAYSSSSRGSSPSNMWVNLLGVYGMAAQSVVQTKTSDGSFLQESAMSGSSIGAKAYIDYGFTDALGFLGGAGFEMFSVSGPGVDGDGDPQTILTDITYLSLDFKARYNLLNGSFKLFVSGGGGLFLPMSSSSNAINADSISTTTIFMFGGGIKYGLSPGMDLIFGVDYYLFPSSDTVTTSNLSINGGISFPL